MGQEFPILVVSPDEPLVDEFGFDPGPKRGAADEPATVSDAVKTGVVSRHVLAIDRGLGLAHVIDSPDQPQHRLLPLLL